MLNGESQPKISDYRKDGDQATVALGFQIEMH